MMWNSNHIPQEGHVFMPLASFYYIYLSADGRPHNVAIRWENGVWFQTCVQIPIYYPHDWVLSTYPSCASVLFENGATLQGYNENER